MTDAVRRVRLLIAAVAVKSARKAISDLLDSEKFPRYEREIDADEGALVDSWQSLGRAQDVILRRYDHAVSETVQQAEAVPA